MTAEPGHQRFFCTTGIKSGFVSSHEFCHFPVGEICFCEGNLCGVNKFQPCSQLWTSTCISFHVPFLHRKMIKGKWKQFSVPSERYSGLASKKVLGLDSKKVGKKEPLQPSKSFSKTRIMYIYVYIYIYIWYNYVYETWVYERWPGKVGAVNARCFARVCFQESIVLTTRSKKESRQHGIRDHDIVASAFALAFAWLMCEAIPPWCHACDYWYQERCWVSLYVLAFDVWEVSMSCAWRHDGWQATVLNQQLVSFEESHVYRGKKQGPEQLKKVWFLVVN